MIEGRKETLGRRIRLGMVGGGEGAFIGAVHRIASRIDDRFEVVAGALSSSPDKAKRSGDALGLAPDRSYPDYAAMAAAEAKRPDGIEAVAVVTPNHVHAPAAKAFLAAGIHVICDKPMTLTLAEARDLKAAADASGLVFVLTHNYTGYPLVRQARAMVRAGDLGDIRVVNVEYAQDWLAEATEATGNKQAEWRTDPARSGAGGCIGDIGTHAYNLADFITGLDVSSLCAELTSFVPGRRLDDNAQILLRYANGARGLLWASQVATGNENALRIRVYGTKGGLEWAQMEPNRMIWSRLGEPQTILTRGGPQTGPDANRTTRVPPGHPEGYLEAFATIYAEAAEAIQAARAGDKPGHDVMHPGVADGVKGLAFIEAAVRSSQGGATWVEVERD